MSTPEANSVLATDPRPDLESQIDRLERELSRSRAEVDELSALIRHIDVATQKARRERDHAIAELTAMRQSLAGQTVDAVHHSMERMLPDGSTGRLLVRQVTRRLGSAVERSRKAQR